MELLEAFELGDLLFEAAIELRVLNGDADVAGERFEQLHVFAGEEVAIVGAAETDDSDGAGAAALAVGDAAGEVVVEVEAAGAVTLRFGQAEDMLRVFEEDVAVCAGTVEVKEANIERSQFRGLQVGEAVGCGKIEVARA